MEFYLKASLTRNSRFIFLSKHGFINLRKHIIPGSRYLVKVVTSFKRKIQPVFFKLHYKAKVLIADWRREYNQVRPHSSLGYRLPAAGT